MGGVGVGAFEQSLHLSIVNRTTYQGSFTNTTVRVQQNTHPSGVVYVPAKYDEPSCCVRLVILRPGIFLGRCAIAFGSSAACGQEPIAVSALATACSSAVRSPSPLNCFSERITVEPRAPLGNAANSSCVNLAIIASIFAAEMWPLLLRCLWRFAASTGASGVKTSSTASTLDVCLKKLVFMLCCGGEALLLHAKGPRCLSSLRSLSGNDTTGFPKRSAC